MKNFTEMITFYDREKNACHWSIDLNTTSEDVVEMLSVLALQDDRFRDIIIDTYDTILMAEVEMDELMNGDEGEE